MANNSSVSVSTKTATRELLAQLAGNQRLVKLFENLAEDVSTNIPGAMDQLQEANEGTRAMAALINAIAAQALEIAIENSERPASQPVAADVDEAPVQPLAVAEAFAVGGIYTSTVATNPAISLGYGTWAAYGAGQFLAGYSPADPDFGTPGSTGGARTLDVADHANHSHSVTTAAVQAGAGTTVVTAVGNETVTLTHAQKTTGTHPMPIIPPYITVYLWQRTA